MKFEAAAISAAYDAFALSELYKLHNYFCFFCPMEIESLFHVIVRFTFIAFRLQVFLDGHPSQGM